MAAITVTGQRHPQGKCAGQVCGAGPALGVRGVAGSTSPGPAGGALQSPGLCPGKSLRLPPTQQTGRGEKPVVDLAVPPPGAGQMPARKTKPAQ